jgi:phosphopantothenate---cysteine ligase (CTP)
MSLEVIITSGGTISKIDDVRNIGNFSSGTTGSLIAEESLRKGAEVHYVHAKTAKKPFRKKINYDQPFLGFVKDICGSVKSYLSLKKYSSQLHEHQFETFDEYQDLVKERVSARTSDAIVLAAAVSDYGCQQTEGKISSDKDTLNVSLEKLPKIISKVKQWDPKIYQVGFKLLSDASVDELVDTAYQHGIKSHSNLTLANTVINGNFKDRINILITPEKGLSPVKLQDVHKKLVETVQRRVSKQHYRTRLDIVDQLEGVEEFKDKVEELNKLNLFEPYFEGSQAEFGFVAQRLPEGFLITSRGSNKSNISLDDVVYVSNVDLEKREIMVKSTGKKASLNANVAARIFQERPDANLIVHSHIFPGVEETKFDYSPSTKEDEEEVVNSLVGKNILGLKNHGVIVLGQDLDDVVSQLDTAPAYNQFPEQYDLIYNRFQKSTDFFDLVVKKVAKEAELLDLAAGTGDVTQGLLERGYENIVLADKSKEMLKVAKRKLGKKLKYIISDFEELKTKPKDAIVIRQAINYLMDYDGLVNGLKQIRGNLNEGGELIFNAPNYSGNGGERIHEYGSGGYNVKVREMNAVNGNVLTHTQNCVLTKQDGSEVKKLYDLNRFGLFSKEEFNDALTEAGFSSMEFYGKGLQEFTEESKTIYCVAVK